MAWPVTDFTDVKFNQNSLGWYEVAAIHLAIKQRADATDHTLKDSAPFDAVFTGTVWLGDPDDDEDRVYLKTLLESFYSAISDLIDGDADIRWTETSGDGTEWTLASLVTDIGMGDFADMLTRAQNYEAFKWLHEALDRLIYPKITVRATTSSGTMTYTRSDGESTLQDAWDGRATNTASDLFPNQLLEMWWDTDVTSGPTYTAEVRSNIANREYLTAVYDGVLVTAFYNYIVTWNDFSPSSIQFTVGTEVFTVTGATSGKRETSDFSISADTYIDADIDTAEPSTVPFSAANNTTRNFSAFITSVALHTNLTTILTDQA